MENITVADRAQLGRLDCGHIKRPTINREEFHLIGFPTFIYMDDCADVTKLQSMCGQINCKNHPVMFFNHCLTS